LGGWGPPYRLTFHPEGLRPMEYYIHSLIGSGRVPILFRIIESVNSPMALYFPGLPLAGSSVNYTQGLAPVGLAKLS
jgi:hypothetical protein